MDQIRRVCDDVFIVTGSIPSIKYSARTCTIGAEYELVQDFLDRIEKHIHNRKGYKTFVFIEPQLDSGYPDVVVIQYSMDGIQQRKTERTELSTVHLRVLSEIDKRKKSSLTHLAQVLGFEMQELAGIVGFLYKAGLVRCTANSVLRMPYKDYFCIKKIIAIEAKIDKWAVAIDQAVNNTRYADESYVLMKRDRCSIDIERRCYELGIGILLMNGKLTRAVKASQERFAKPYITFLFNEWIQQLEEMEGWR